MHNVYKSEMDPRVDVPIPEEVLPAAYCGDFGKERS